MSPAGSGASTTSHDAPPEPESARRGGATPGGGLLSLRLSGGGQQLASRPSCRMTKEPLAFEVDAEGLPPETDRLLLHIKKVAEDVLYHWKTFPIVLPAPLAIHHDHASSNTNTTVGTNSSSTGAPGHHHHHHHKPSLSNSGVGVGGRVRPLVLRDAFVTPSFDELDAVAVDSKGDPRRLSEQHLHSLREKGEFEVESLHFPGQTHRWRVSSCLQKGCERAHDTLLNDVARAVALIIITARNRITSPTFSVSNSAHSLWQGIVMLVDLAVGVPWVQAHNLEARMKEERCSYLVQELTCKDGDVESLCSWMVQQIKRATREKFQLSGEKQPPVPYVFTTPQGQELDLRLFNREIMKKALPVLVGILEKEARGWFLHFREKVVADLKAQNLSDAEIEKEGNYLVQEEYLKRVYAAILSNTDLQNLGQNIPQLLVDQARAVLLMHRALDEVERIYEEGERKRKEELNHSHPILYRVEPWLGDQLKATHDALIEQHKWRPHEHALALCKEHSLSNAYFLQRDLSFMREREPVLQKELRNLKVAMRAFHWRAQIWFPGNYTVRRTFLGETEIIPTVLSSSPTSITTPRTDPNQPVFLLEKQLIRSTSTRWPFWRWFNFLHRTWAWMCNALFFFGVWLPMCSPVSLRALLSQEPFMPDFELSQVNGTVCPSKASLTPTLASRLHILWRHISKSRTHFETTPDTGFIGKGVTRHMNRAWNYVLKGIVGTIFLTTIFPLTCIILSLGSLAIALAAPLWVPALVIVVHLICILVYDIDAPTSNRRVTPILQALVWYILVLGIIQPILALGTATVVCPVLAFLALLVGVARRGVRHVWDTLMFHSVIKKRGRIPASDSFLVKRIAGPGLHNNFYYQISCEQAAAAFEARLELDELAAYQREMERRINKPLNEYSEFVRRIFGPFSGVLGKGGVYGKLDKEAKDLTQTLQEKIERRRRDLTLGLPVNVRAKVKMTTRELKLALKQATILLEDFYPSHVLARITHPKTTDNQNSERTNADRDANNESNNGGDSDTGGISGGDSESSDSKETATVKTVMVGRIGTLHRTEVARGPTYENLITEDEWWDGKGMAVGDYAGLASLIFTEIFSPDFLTPMEETDTSFQMEVHGVSLARYTEILRCLPDRSDLDEKLTVHTPRGNIQIHAPYLDLASFTPLVRHGVPTQRTEKASLAARLSLRLNPGQRMVCKSRLPEKLLIPPPIPHPAHIAVIIHNREAANSIALDATLTLQVLRTIEDSPHVVATLSPISLEEEGEESQASQSRSSTVSREPSVYDAPYAVPYSLPSSRSATVDGRGVQGRSRTATLEMTATLERGGAVERVDYNRSSTLELTPSRMAQRLTSPLRSLLEGQRPFTVALNLASAEDVSLEIEEESDHLPLPHQSITQSTYTTAV
ncbi:uncharacterized protein LOC143020023 isoform X3 [Oratosquilla oratoria]|uniref:uncharacterized protein LOC143020023 isoform X3 n=1 Tax=Oratosquilla oratoria TaxID=337810 RepID=UPI003F76356B